MIKAEQSVLEGVQETPTLEMLLASICYLMTRHARLPDANISKAISEHLELLSEHPECASEILRNMGKRLSCQWREHLQGDCCVRNENRIHLPASFAGKLH